MSDDLEALIEHHKREAFSAREDAADHEEQAVEWEGYTEPLKQERAKSSRVNRDYALRHAEKHEQFVDALTPALAEVKRLRDENAKLQGLLPGALTAASNIGFFPDVARQLSAALTQQSQAGGGE